MIFTLPAATPVTTPDELTVAFVSSLESHVPPLGEPVKVMVLPTVTDDAPDIDGEVQSPAATVTDLASDQQVPDVL